MRMFLEGTCYAIAVVGAIILICEIVKSVAITLACM